MSTTSHITAAIITLLCAACAHTDLYHDGKKVARFEGDMRGMKFCMSENGAFEWSGDIDHSTATLAQGKAAEGKIQASGLAIAASGITALTK